MLDTGVLKVFIWFDTRDMFADGLTKGSVDRKALHMVMDGRLTVDHAFKTWKPKVVLNALEEYLKL